MPTPICRQCRRVITGEDINVAQDLAYCRPCNRSYRLSQLAYDAEVTGSLDLQNPPKGAWYINNGGHLVIGAITRDIGSSIGLMIFGLFWNGFAFTLVFALLINTLRSFNLFPAAWLPAFKMEGGSAGASGFLLLLLFLIPFVAVGLWIVATCLMGLFGHEEVRIKNNQAIHFSGVRSLGWRRTYDISEVNDVFLNERQLKRGKSYSILVETRTGMEFEFGSSFTNERRMFVLGALRKTLLK